MVVTSISINAIVNKNTTKMTKVSIDAMKSLMKRMGRVPGGFKKLFVDTKKVFLISYGSQPKNDMTKRQAIELKRYTKLAWSKLSVLFLFQLVPIIGNIPVSSSIFLISKIGLIV